MNAAKWFDTNAELQKLRSTPPKAPKPPKAEDEDKSNFSHFSRGEGTKAQISVPHNPLFAAVLSEYEAAPFLDGGREFEPAAVTWLRSRLATPQRIADLFNQWCAEGVGHPSQEISARMDLLNDARWALDVQPFVGNDGRFWWRLPQGTVQ